MADVILFDGVCNFCNASINFVMDHDEQRRFRFASLQSDYGKKVLSENQRSILDLDTVLLVRNGKLYEKSTAALEIVRYLRGWSWLYVLRFVPRFISDFFYSIIATNRYRIFGKSDSCRIPTAEERSLFIA